jgi:siroheme synthase-like protein
MAIPASVEPFVEPEVDAGHTPGAIERAVARPAVLLAVVAVGALAALPIETVRASAGYAIAIALGAGVTGLLARRRRGALDAQSAAGLPRLPVFLRFDDRRVVVVGGGIVAAAKVPALLAAGARVTVIAPSVSQDIDRARVEVIERAFEPSDLDGAWFVTAAATPAVNRQVRDAAEPRGLFVNAVDDPANATAYLGGTLARGGVTVAFSTAGQAPALAGLLREAFDELLPDDLDMWARRAHELRNRQRRDGVPMGARRPQLLDALNDLYDARDRPSAGRP